MRIADGELHNDLICRPVPILSHDVTAGGDALPSFSDPSRKDSSLSEKGTPEHSDVIRVSPSRIPPERLTTYARLWELETWLRTMVYTELRSRYGDAWQSHVEGSSHNQFQRDKHLTHMPTREILATSYLQLTDLLSTISSNWCLFQPYLPPKEVWDGKLHELKQIRHRVAHFRIGHRHDANRLEQFLRDVDHGFWHFCTSYNTEWTMLPPSKDPVAKSLLHLDPFPWTETEPGHWSRLGIADPNLRISVWLNVLRRPWLASPPTDQIAGTPGCLYDTTIVARNSRVFDFDRFFATTDHVHARLCHICFGHGFDSIRVTVPALLGATAVADIFADLVASAENALTRRPGATPVTEILTKAADEPNPVDLIAERYPEYVLGPSNPMTFLDPDMPCSFFNVD